MRTFIAAATLTLLSAFAPVHADNAAKAADVPAQQAKAAAPLNINTATAKELAKGMKGIGIKKAEAIVAHREKNGQFKSVEDLLKVKGVGPATLQKNASRLAVN